jgi:predicted ATPase
MFIKKVSFNYDFYNNCKNNVDNISEYDVYINDNLFPFNLDVFNFFKSGGELNFDKPVTFFVGENGCGKTTFIESLAFKLGLNKFGGGKNFKLDESSKPVFSDFLSFDMSLMKFKDAFFFRAENFFNLEEELEKYSYSGINKKELVYEYTGSSKNFREMSHGQGFKAFFENRVRQDGIYIFDEPESALSVQSQIEFLFLLKELIKLNNQIFIITHSPIILSFPNAEIYDISDNFSKVKYKDCSQLNDIVGFLKNVNMYRKSLLE